LNETNREPHVSKVYTKIGKETLASWREEFLTLSDPEEFRARVDKIIAPLSGETFFNQAGLQFLRDAWIASRVSTALSADKVRLLPTERPDFEVVSHSTPRHFEATEADFPGRRRGDEYRTERPESEPDPVSQWRRRFEAVPVAVGSVISKKLAKPYASDVSLVIKVNLGCYGAYMDEGAVILQRECRAAKDAFFEVFAIWEGVLFSFWKQGRKNSQRWNTARLEEL
jgi:hypothetical protein